MKLIEGRTLKDLIASTESIQQRLSLVPHIIAVADAIAYAHNQNIIHRDLKPSNIVIGEFGETVVVDWGLAKAVGRTDPGSAPDERTLVPLSSSSLAETLPGSALGTPAYMSPEQASG